MCLTLKDSLADKPSTLRWLRAHSPSHNLDMQAWQQHVLVLAVLLTQGDNAIGESVQGAAI